MNTTTHLYSILMMILPTVSLTIGSMNIVLISIILLSIGSSVPSDLLFQSISLLGTDPFIIGGCVSHNYMFMSILYNGWGLRRVALR